jgi:hypothetical protein
MSKQELKLQRVSEVNAVIKAISNHGRRFFFNHTHGRVGEMVMCKTGHLYFVDDYSGKPIYVANKGRWRGFPHGGTLRSLVESFSHYIRTGDQLHPGLIGLERTFTEGDIWGYGKEAIAAVNAEIIGSPVFAAQPAPGRE